MKYEDIIKNEEILEYYKRGSRAPALSRGGHFTRTFTTIVLVRAL